MRNTIKVIKDMVKEGHLQKAVKEILLFVESDKYRNNETVKDIYYSTFADGGTIKEMMDDEDLKFLESNDIDSINAIDNYTYYIWLATDEDMAVTYLNEITILEVLEDLEKAIKN